MYYITFFFLLISNITNAQKVKLDGIIRNESTNLPLQKAQIIEIANQDTIFTNEYGQFQFTINPGLHQFSVSYDSYQPDTLSLLLTKDTLLVLPISFELRLNVIEISEPKLNIENQTQMSLILLPIQKIEHTPVLFGESDAFKVLQLLPGVQGGQEGQSSLFVRGGNADQNLILLDGVHLYNPFHLFGFFSVFNSDIIKDVSLLKGAFPARYGGRLASVIELNTKNQKVKEWHKQVSVGLIATRFVVQGPIKPNTSILAAARYSYADWVFRPILKTSFEANGIDGKLNNAIYDFNFGLHQFISKREELKFGFYFSKDQYGRTEKMAFNDNLSSETLERLNWQNSMTYLQWNKTWHEHLSSSFKLYYTGYELLNRVGFKSNGQLIYGQVNQLKDTVFTSSEYDLSYIAAIKDIGLKTDFVFSKYNKHQLKFGSQVILHNFKPGNFRQYIYNYSSIELPYILDTTTIQNTKSPFETATYLEDEIYLSAVASLNVGVHFSTYHTDSRSYYSLQPRLITRYKIFNGIALKSSIVVMRQYLHQLTNPGIGLPTDIWLPSTARIKPQDGWQAALGLAKTVKGEYEISFETYYKRMENVLNYKEGAGLFDTRSWEDQVTQGKGWTYGGELLFQKTKGRWNGWLAYTLAWSWRQFEELNGGKKFYFRYDRRHNLDIVVNFRVNEKISLSANWILQTGDAVTLPTRLYTAAGDRSYSTYYSNRFIDVYESKNNFRMPTYHRMDISLDIVNLQKNPQQTWSFSIYNVYNKINPFYLNYGFRSKENLNNNSDALLVFINGVALFPIIPSVNYKLTF